MSIILPGLDAPIYVYDVECYPDFFLCAFMEVNTGEILRFEISPRRNDATALKQWLTAPAARDCLVIGFNNFAYDDILSAAVVYGIDDPMQLHEMSSAIIASKDRRPRYHSPLAGPDRPMLIDLMAILTSGGSLKQYGVKLDHPKLRELPFDPTRPLGDAAKMALTAEYNLNDLGMTKTTAVAVAGDIEARFKLTCAYATNVLSLPDKALGEKILGHLYEREYSRRETWEKPANSVLHPAIGFSDPALVAAHQRMGAYALRYVLKTEDVIDPTTGVAERNKSIESNPYTDTVVFRNLTVNLGMGGAHSIDAPGVFQEDEDSELLELDFASYYPNLILSMRLHPEHLQRSRFLDAYKLLVDDRLRAVADGDTVLASGLKIAINSVFGKSGSPWSWLLDPILGATVCLSGQLILLMLIELVSQFDNVVVLSANTDGILLRTPRDSAALRDAVGEFADLLAMKIKVTPYAKFIRRDISDYMALTTTGKRIGKGVFLADSPISKKGSKRIIVRAVHAHFFDNVPVSETIRGSTDICEFLDWFKVSPGWHAEDARGNRLTKINRWYESTAGEMLWKVKGAGTEQEQRVKFANVERATLVPDLPANFPSDINYGHYEAAALAHIESIEDPAIRENNLVAFADLKPAQQARLRVAQNTDTVDLAVVAATDYTKAASNYRSGYKGGDYRDSMRSALIALWIAEAGRLSKGDLLYIAGKMDESEGNFAPARKRKELGKMVAWITTRIPPFKKVRPLKLYHKTIFDSSLVKIDWIKELLSIGADDDGIAKVIDQVQRRADKHAFDLTDEIATAIIQDIQTAFDKRN